jgi:hypothetical protein
MPRSASARAVTAMVAAIGALACGDAEDERAFEWTTLVRHPGGFGGAPASPESTCSGYTYRSTFAVDGATRGLSFDACAFTAPDVHTLLQGQRTLTDAELGSIEHALARLAEGTPESRCGPDAGFLTLDVREKGSTDLYISASHCPGEFSIGRTLATGIADLWTNLDALSRE